MRKCWLCGESLMVGQEWQWDRRVHYECGLREEEEAAKGRDPWQGGVEEDASNGAELLRGGGGGDEDVSESVGGGEDLPRG